MYYTQARFFNAGGNLDGLTKSSGLFDPSDSAGAGAAVSNSIPDGDQSDQQAVKILGIWVATVGAAVSCQIRLARIDLPPFATADESVLIYDRRNPMFNLDFHCMFEPDRCNRKLIPWVMPIDNNISIVTAGATRVQAVITWAWASKGDVVI